MATLRQKIGNGAQIQTIRGVGYRIMAGEHNEVETLGVPNVLVVRQDLPEQTAYRLTELLFHAKPQLVAAHEEARRLAHRSALTTYPIELHAGAQTYYRENKSYAASR